MLSTKRLRATMSNNSSLVVLNQYLSKIKEGNQVNQVGDLNLNQQQVKELNYEVMYSVLMSTCENFIITNQGHRLADELKDEILRKFGHLVSKLAG